MSRRMRVVAVGFCCAWWGTACAPKPAIQAPPVVEQPSATPVETMGTWENRGTGSAPAKMIFQPSGQLIFAGGLESFNPARWEVNPDAKELILTFPEIDVNKLQIFQMYLGQGVKAFNPQRKQVTYHFDSETTTLNVAGWDYSKPAAKAAPLSLPPEPVVK